MSHAFTIVPETAIGDVLHAITRTVKGEPAIIQLRRPCDTVFYFAGTVDVLRLAKSGGFLGLACVRIPVGSGVLQVDTEGYEASVEALARFVGWVLREFGRCRVFDDETGEDLDARDPRVLFEPEPEFVAVDS